MERFTEVDGMRLRALRKELALSQHDLERMSGVAQHTISDLEAGKRGARPSTLRKLAQSLGVAPRELIKTEGSDA
jgi:transcriptional regulator with XRE-family HTH domain